MKASPLISFMIAYSALLLSGCADSNPVEAEQEHFEAIGFYVLAEEDTMVQYVDGVVTGTLDILNGTTSPLYQIHFLQDNGKTGLPPTDQWTLGWQIADVSVSDIISSEADHALYNLQLSALKIGQTTIIIQIFHNDHKDFESEKIPIIVSSSDPRP